MHASRSAEYRFISDNLNPRVAHLDDFIGTLRHKNRKVPAELYRALIEELFATAGELAGHPTFRKIHTELRNRHQEAVSKSVRRARNHAAPPALPPTHGFVTDAYCQGKIGNVDLNSGCYSFYETWPLAARVIAENGLTAHVKDILKSGATVRELLRSMFGISSERRPSHNVSEADERRAFLRTLRRMFLQNTQHRCIKTSDNVFARLDSDRAFLEELLRHGKS